MTRFLLHCILLFQHPSLYVLLGKQIVEFWFVLCYTDKSLSCLETQTPLLSLPKTVRFSLFAYSGLADRFRRARGFL